MKQSQMNQFLKRPPNEKRVEEEEDKKKLKLADFKIDGQKFTLSPKQAEIVYCAVHEKKNIFFTGAGGVGKSLTMKVLTQKLIEKYQKQHVFVTASTGIAACHIGGSTLHSFAGAGLGEGMFENLLKKVRTRADALSRWRLAKVLIIDEISMIVPSFFELLDKIARRIRIQSKHLPFGGIQLIICGDFLQLPYVDKDEQAPEEIQFLFETPLWKEIFDGENGLMYHLTQVYRQKDDMFIELLHAIRMGNPLQRHLEILKSRVHASLDCSDGIQPTMLYPHRKDVELENNLNLQKITSDIHTFTAIDKGKEKHVQALDKNCQAQKILHLKVGAQVVLLRNLDFVSGLVNGARGIVVDFSEIDSKVNGSLSWTVVPVVKFTNGVTCPIAEAEWKMEQGDVLLCNRIQIPLSLCWASSIHKAMGMTLDKVETKLGTVFGYGMVYTVLSRVTSLEGLSIMDGVDVSRILAHPRVVQFYQGLNQ